MYTQTKDLEYILKLIKVDNIYDLTLYRNFKKHKLALDIAKDIDKLITEHWGKKE